MLDGRWEGGREGSFMAVQLGDDAMHPTAADSGEEDGGARKERYVAGLSGGSNEPGGGPFQAGDAILVARALHCEYTATLLVPSCNYAKTVHPLGFFLQSTDQLSFGMMACRLPNGRARRRPRGALHRTG